LNILILGGTAFLGRHLVEEAQNRGHTITLFNRGRTNPELFPQIETIHGDRQLSLAPLTDRQWDVVIDTSGNHPTAVRASAELLMPHIGRYLFISTISVYADFSTSNINESSALLRLENPSQAEVSNKTYGSLKTHCEDVVIETYGSRSLIIRPGLIVGPHDPTDRFTYWPVRTQRGGEILAPEGPHPPVQYIDVRDLAAWSLDAAANELEGVFNATGPATDQSLGELLGTCQIVANVPSTLTWVSPEFIAEQNVAPFLELPLWVPGAMAGLLTINCQRAIDNGLHFRTPQQTVRDTLSWHASRPAETELKAGLSLAREAELLSAWHEHEQ
jgi:2'-hydroxyisoflavone reductase